MSQFGAKNTPWGRPMAQQLNPQLFTGQLGLAAAAAQQFAVPQATVQLGPAGLGVGNLGGIPAVNAAAFSSAPQTLGVNALSRAQPQMALPQQQQTQQPSKNQRAFVGVVTKLQENYGFVDDDVFFQTSVVRGAMPRVNERVMVEANYNPNMPFKWNAFRIQLLPNQDGTPAVQQVLQQQQARPREDRWGPAPQAPMISQGGSSGADYRTSSRDRSPPPIRRERRERSPPPRRPSPVHRRSPPRRRSPSPRRHGSVVSSSSVGHKRERSPRRPSPRDRERDSGGGSRSPPRRRARIIPRYNVQVPKISMDV